ncbi:putative C-mannosyltransferase DPY19L1 [Pitangus sulphuratus]|nr:putative C-mannosyltransferase DPY19L1 [Pitangus sulphuratus]
MRKGGGGRRGARGDPRGPCREGPAAEGERDLLGRGPLRLLRVCGEQLRVFVVDKKAFIIKADSKIWLTFLLAVVAGVLHWCHITALFENDRHFSHLSTLEREMAFRTEMGLYYSYFKIIIEAPSFWNGVWAIMNDRLTEYPLVINTLQRFNLYPEVVLASWYRMYTSLMDFLGVPTKTCWTVNRGKGLSPVESCEGLGDPAFFYVAVIFLLNGLMMSLFFIYGTYLRIPNINTGSLIALCVSNVFFMLPWQFAQFVLLTQVSLLVCFILMFGNSMLLTSYYAASLVVISAHIGNILKSKFIGYKDFDTLMYTCAAEFDFMEKEALKSIIWSLSQTGQYEREERFNHAGIPCIAAVGIQCPSDFNHETKTLFDTPSMCYGFLGVFKTALMAIEGSANLQTQWNIMGEFSNLPQEELLEWIKVNTRQDAVFAGAMPTMASVKLSTLRPIVNHPHYEDAGLRARTKVVYSMYSRKPANEVKRELMALGVNYYILEESLCVSRKKPGCSMPEIWDVEDPANRGKIPLCTLMSKNSRPYFITVFENSNYRVLKIPKE